ncbi:pantetheine-phosphate adenylyltransferase [Salisediminibacterium halotolerans]|uniref:pantetheine-phosphate adenylyltransferase n=1 Tax=Salisediminibacterium halotolerans TaxID=517425 RepID=UPI000EB0C0BF|nr:pantetheine-phosphate adenylyltransferase [Salisediminibacterium halotolerans]RLJ74324.1 phosphopantetheine adenylyltransferase [Actinophytocola xinjiangensis]RPE87583.1 phosphopantetheine adenylyltransferase [Salisediminibacterium halotolerans]TWG35161.1 phosphopantetheine adenylyltransferase [Salisediminibacterium halotolerans]GEL08628.1 phosphopantetheine adenylyltransferase [Salisediminibacterium halotolerans]
MQKTAIVPGSFDPVTLGHIDIINRAAVIFDKVIVSVLNNQHKNPLFSVEERIELLQLSLKEQANIEIDSFDGLLIDYVNQKEADVIIKGLRAVSDFEYELQMASINRKLDDKVETFFMMTNPEYSYLSSSIVKELSRHGATTSDLVPESVEKALQEKFTR